MSGAAGRATRGPLPATSSTRVVSTVPASNQVGVLATQSANRICIGPGSARSPTSGEPGPGPVEVGLGVAVQAPAVLVRDEQ